MKSKRSKKLKFKNRTPKLALVIAFASIMVIAGFLAHLDKNKAAADNIYKLVCDYADSVDCMSLQPGVSIQSDRYIYSELNSQSWTWNAVQRNICNGGYVSSTCPFRIGSGLNTRYEGRPIYRFKLHANTDYCASMLSQYMYLRSCSDYPEQLFVRGPRGTHYAFINVGASDDANTGMALTMCFKCHLYASLDNGSALTSNWDFYNP